MLFIYIQSASEALLVLLQGGNGGNVVSIKHNQ